MDAFLFLPHRRRFNYMTDGAMDGFTTETEQERLERNWKVAGRYQSCHMESAI